MAQASEAESPNHSTRIVLYPIGIHCPDCARDMIDGTLRGRPGVVDASFDPVSGALSVDYLASRTSEDDIRAVITDLGYGLDEGKQPGSSAGRLGNTVAVALIVVALVVFIVLMRVLAG